MFNLLGIVAIVIFTQMALVWVIYRITKNPSIVDVSWAVGLMISGLIYLWSQPVNSRLCIISFLLILWGGRLSFYLWFTRIRKGIVDKRYLSLSENWKIAKPLGFFLNFELQGLFILVISSVFLLAATSAKTAMSSLDWLGGLIVLIGIAGETIADQQLYRFQHQRKGEVCALGLWHYTRHPNYFFEWLVWCGFALFGMQHPLGCASMLSPLLLYFIMTKITGPMTEQGSIKSKGEAYLHYQRQTPMFFPFKF